ncbi:MAG: S8 family serine peptidase, partial [Candidatus Zixiibacteriota bacterium]
FVERVEPVGLYRMTATPNDFYYDSSTTSFPYMQWHYWDNYGINVDSAWDKETGDPDVIVAVIDGGVRYYHYELGGTNPPGPNDSSTNGNIWVNDGEIPGNGIDDDNNGYIDDVIGWDFVESASWCNDADCSDADNDPADHGGHGTHISGTIAAITNNDPNWGVAGVAGGWNNGTTDDIASGVKIMCLRAGWTSIFGGLIGMDYVSEAMYYVATMVDKGYNVTAINCSWGSSSLIADATDAVLARDVMVIVAAGNDNSSSCDYLGCREDCLDVGSTDKYGNPADFSNYGTWVDIAAPGVEILSTYHNSNDPEYDYIALMDGTSMSCPHVVGVAGLLESYNSSLTGPQKFDVIVNNYKPYNMTKYVGAGIVDAGKCIDAAGPACDVTADFTADVLSGCAPLTVQFTDQSTGPVTSWDWDFGDGGSSQAQNPSHQYQDPGTYTVQLIVCSATCCDT